jgi:hypothetical protein
MDKSDFSEFFALLAAYRNFRLFLARMTAFIALAYGIVTFSPYFFLFGSRRRCPFLDLGSHD